MLEYKYDIQKIKEMMTDDQVFELLEELDAEPYWERDGIIVCKTVCHGGDSHKLFYYCNTKLFRCYTHCNEYMDIFELTRKVLSVAEGKDILLQNAIEYIANSLEIAPTSFSNEKDLSDVSIKSWRLLKLYNKILKPETKRLIELKKYNDIIYNHYPIVDLKIWQKEGISQKVIEDTNIRFDPYNYGILIPHYDIDNNLVGVRIRFLAEDMINGGKYKPAILNKEMYNHPLSFNLYNINKSKENIMRRGTALIFESEKSCLQYKTLYGAAADISVACCGSNLSSYQIKLLTDLNIKEIIICFDKQFQKVGDEEWLRHRTLLEKLQKKIKNYCSVSFVEDWCGDVLQYKSSPTDEGKEKFERLLMNRKGL